MSINVEERVLKIPIPLGGTEGSSVEEATVQLPPEYPDIDKIVYAEGIVNLTNPAPVLGQAILSGTVDIGLIYQTRQGEKTVLQGVEFSKAVEFSIPVEIADLTPESLIEASVKAESVTATAGKGRSIKLDVVLAYELESSRVQESKVLTGITGVDQKVKVSSEPLEVKDYVGRVDLVKKVEAVLNLTKADFPVDRILRVGVNPVLENSRCLAGKVVVEGSLDFDLIYVPKEAAPVAPPPEPAPVNPEEEVIQEPGTDDEFFSDFTESAPGVPFVAKKEFAQAAKFVLSVDLKDARPEMKVEAKLLAGAVKAAVAGGDKVEVTLDLKGVAMVFEGIALEMVTSADLEDGEDRIDLNRAMLSIPQVVARSTKELVVTGTPGVPASKAELKEVLMAQAKAEVSQCKLAHDKITVSGKVHLSVLYTGENELGAEIMDYLKVEKGLDFKETLEVPGVEAGMLVKAEADIATTAVSILDPFTLEANLLLTLNVEVADMAEKEIVLEAAVAVPAPKDGASIRVVVVQAGDTLWKLARRYGTTMEFIAQYNKLEDVNDLASGQRLRIPAGA